MAIRFPEAFTPDIEELRRVFDYNPQTGTLRWKIHRRPRTHPGDDAGTVLPNGYISVTYKGQTYMGHHLAWALHYGEWPSDRVIFKAIQDMRGIDNEKARIKARSNLRIDGLDLQSYAVSEKPSAQSARKYRQTRIENRAPLYERKRSVYFGPSDTRIRYSKESRAWTFIARPAPHVIERVMAKCTTREEAAKVAAEYDANVAIIAANPPVPDLPYRIPGLPSGLLQELTKWIAYDPATGRMAWREILEEVQRPPEMFDKASEELKEIILAEPPMYHAFILGGLSAVTHIKSSSVPYVRFHRRRLSAARIAWALTHKGDYPGRKGVRFRNNDFTDLRLANLERVHDPLETNN